MELREIINLVPVNNCHDKVVFTGRDYSAWVRQDGEWSSVDNLESITFNEDLTNNTLTGLINLSVYDKDGILELGVNPKQPFDLIITGLTQNGDIASEAVVGILITNILRGRTSTDIGNSIEITFTASKYIPWRPITKEKLFLEI